MIRRLLLLVLTLVPAVATAQGTCQTYNPDQRWIREQRERFWYTSQGSRLWRYDGFVALEEPQSTTLLKDRLTGFGFTANPSSTGGDGLPIGFVRDPGTPGKSRDAVGLTCAACHTLRIQLNTTPVIIDGGTTLADFERFMLTLEDALKRNGEDQAKFDRFAKRVLGPNPDPGQTDMLRAELKAKADELYSRWNRYWPKTGSGPGRIDAFGQIFNQVAAHDIGAPQNARVADAPVSYPFLWNTPRHDFVQWNASAENGFLLGFGRLFRNVGEVLGVFGEVTASKPSNGVLSFLPSYSSSIRIRNLVTLEGLLNTLRPPRWPKECADVDPTLAKEGQKTYKRLCQACHVSLARTETRKRFKVTVDPAKTDSRMLDNFEAMFLEDTIETGTLAGQPKILKRGAKFGKYAEGQEIMANVILGAVNGLGRSAVNDRSAATRAIEWPWRALATPQSTEAAAHTQMVNAKKNIGYKARPLNGVWATAPYLHNGSVPTLCDLLMCEQDEKTGMDKPRPDRFYVGSTQYDFKKVGFSTAASAGAVRFDTTLPGNYNGGHEGFKYGTKLKHAEKMALLEYLKVVGELPPIR